MKAKNRVWYSLEKLDFDEEGYTPALLVGEHGKVVGEWPSTDEKGFKDGKVVGEWPSTDEKGFLMVLIKYQVWEK